MTMNARIKRFLDFNGKKVYFLAADGHWWIAIKPICDALGVNYERQREQLTKELKGLQLPPSRGVVEPGQLFREQGMLAADGKTRKMLCLPEFFIYGWLFKLRGKTPEFKAYQQKCYEVLYNHFRGMLTLRMELLQERAYCIKRSVELRNELQSNPDYVQLLELDRREAQADKAIRKAYKELVEGQTSLWENN